MADDETFGYDSQKCSITSDQFGHNSYIFLWHLAFLAVSNPSANQAQPCLASVIQQFKVTG